MSATCHDMVVEAAKHHGREYAWVVRTRYDLKWTAPHLPLSRLDPHYIWLPAEEGWWSRSLLSGPGLRRAHSERASELRCAWKKSCSFLGLVKLIYIHNMS